MNKNKFHVVTIGLARNILREGREQERMKLYAKHLERLSIIVLTRKEHGFTRVVQDGKLYVYPTNSHNRFMMLVDAFRMGFQILHEDIETRQIVSAQDPLLIGWFSWLLAKVTRVQFHVQVHGDYFGGGWSGHSPLRHIQLFFALVLLRRTPAIRVVSERIKTSLTERGIKAEKISILPIRPELESFLSFTHVVRIIPPYTFLFIGRLAPEKDIARIVRAFALMHAQHPEARLRIVGEGSEREHIEELIVSLQITDAVALLPWTDDVPKEMSTADIFLLASKHEAYALTLVEAMAVGLPLITTDVGCVGEVVEDGVHGVVVYEEGDRAYAEAMLRLYTDADLQAKYGRAGKEIARTLAMTSPEAYVDAWVTALIQRV